MTFQRFASLSMSIGGPFMLVAAMVADFIHSDRVAKERDEWKAVSEDWERAFKSADKSFNKAIVETEKAQELLSEAVNAAKLFKATAEMWKASYEACQEQLKSGNQTNGTNAVKGQP
jgi:hypothetical protein